MGNFMGDWTLSQIGFMLGLLLIVIGAIMVLVTVSNIRTLQDVEVGRGLILGVLLMGLGALIEYFFWGAF